MKILNLLSMLLLGLGLVAYANPPVPQGDFFPQGSNEVNIPQVKGVRAKLLYNIAPIPRTSIAQGHYPGAVILAAHNGHIIYKGVFGSRRLIPSIAAMKIDTIFDLASLTKVVATTPAIMQLLEKGKIALDAPVSLYWPTFSQRGKKAITVRQLLTHTSGMPSGIKIKDPTQLKIELEQIGLVNKPGAKFLYSDVNFIVLAELIKIITGEAIDQYAAKHIYRPLNMRDTFFTLDSKLLERIAPTEIRQGQLFWGVVHDPSAYKLQGVSGNAGLFSTAKDLGIYAQALLDGGRISASNKHEYFLSPLSILKMTTPNTPERIADARGLGWDIDSQFSNRGVLFSTHSYGHSGWTGTSMWIDPTTRTWLIILTSSKHPHAILDHQLKEDRIAIANIIAASITDIDYRLQNNTSASELNRASLAE